jgi:anti-anti-sigma factor
MYMTISSAPFRRRQRSSGLGQRQGRDNTLNESCEDAAPAPSHCRVTSTVRGNVAVFGLQGELDQATSKEVRVLLSAAVEEAAVLLDLRDVTVADSEGVAVLRDVIRCVYENGGQVAISRPWRLARSLSDLLDAEGLVLVALAVEGGVTWLGEHPNLHPVNASRT